MRNLLAILSIGAVFVAGSAVVHSIYDVVEPNSVTFPHRSDDNRSILEEFSPDNKPINSLNTSPACKLIQRQFEAQYNRGKNIDLSSNIRDAFTDEKGTTTIRLNNSAISVHGGKKLDVTNPFQAVGVRWAEWITVSGFGNRWDAGGYKTSIVATANIQPEPGHVLALTIGGWGWRGYVYRVYSVPKAQWGLFLENAKKANPNSTFGFKAKFATKVYPNMKLNRFANIFSYRDQLFYIEENEDEETRVTTYQLRKKDVSRLACEIKRGNKIRIDGRWTYKGQLLTSYCFSKIWMSGDNYEHYEEKFGKDQNLDDFRSYPGRYIGGSVPIRLIKSPDWIDASEVSLSRKLSDCVNSEGFQQKKGVEIVVENGLVVSKFPEAAKFADIRHPIEYRLLKKIPLKNCQRFTPYLFKSCVDLGLVEIREESGGTIGVLRDIGIYGIVKDPNTKKHYVIPLVNLGNLSDSMDYVARLKK
jgi:hypothetical protein